MKRDSPHLPDRPKQRRFVVSRRPEHCPGCGQPTIAEVLYGLPDFNDDLRRRIDRGEIVLGGCVIIDGQSPEWRCTTCGAKLKLKEHDQ